MIIKKIRRYRSKSNMRGVRRTPGPERRSQSYNRVALKSWRPQNGLRNFGDELSQVIVSLVLADNARTLDDPSRKTTSLLAVGSILHFAEDGDVIWGSGWNGKIRENKFQAKMLDVRAVRGPLTQEFLVNRGIPVPDLYGDPATLLPAFYCPDDLEEDRNGTVAVIPNLNETGIIKKLVLDLNNPSLTFIDPTWPWRRVIDDICLSSKVIATSLHGLILAESYGIPAILLRISEIESMFKFQDYYEGSGRLSFPIATSLHDALKSDPPELARHDRTALRNAFPLDLWAGSHS